VKGGKKTRTRERMKARAQSAKRRRSKTAASQPKPDESRWSETLLERTAEGAVEFLVRAAVKSVSN
jgi:hypothetical protein